METRAMQQSFRHMKPLYAAAGPALPAGLMPRFVGRHDIFQ